MIYRKEWEGVAGNRKDSEGVVQNRRKWKGVIFIFKEQEGVERSEKEWGAVVGSGKQLHGLFEIMTPICIKWHSTYTKL